MHDERTRATVLELHEKGHAKRAIARALKISRKSVNEIIKSESKEVPKLIRLEKAEEHHDSILALYKSCDGNLVRVHEELNADGAHLSYQALTAYCRKHFIGHEPKEPAGRYPFKPGKEMQHDTSPHPVEIAGQIRNAQLTGLVLGFSALSFLQLYPRFTRFECKIFLDDAIDYVGGVCEECMVDNTSVIRLRGTGRDMVPVPEMEAFAEQRGFVFRAHEKGDANRSARVETFFNYVQNNFLAGRKFDSWEHANKEAIAWCDKINAAFSSKLHGSRRDLFASERPHLKPLPIWRPDVYQLHHRIVDLEGYVNVHRRMYSVPTALIGKSLEIRETKTQILIFDGPRLVTTHQRVIDGPRRILLPEHQHQRRKRVRSERYSLEKRQLFEDLPEFAQYIAEIEKRAPRGRALESLRRLRRMLREYPRGPFLGALHEAARYGLYDLARVERMILKRIQGDFFPHFVEQTQHDDDDREVCDD
jgi:transposase